MGIRDKARQNLIVRAINVVLERRLMALDRHPIEDTTFAFELLGLPVIASVCDIGFDEVSVKAIICPTTLGRKFVGCLIWPGFRRFGAAAAWGVLERRTGKYLQTTGNYHGAKAVTGKLSELAIVPHGFGLEPTADGYDFHRECEAVFGPPRSRYSHRARI